MKLIDDWKASWKLASVQVYALILLFPDIYNAVAALGWLGELPPAAMWAVRALAAAGIAARLIKQKPAEG